MLFSLIIYHAWKDYRTQPDSNAVPLLRVLYRGNMIPGWLVKILTPRPDRWSIIIHSHGFFTNLECRHRTWLSSAA